VSTGNKDVIALHEKAESQILAADTKEKLLDLIQTYESILKSDPENRKALSGLGRFCFLAGLGYADTVDETGEFSLKAIQYNERLMCLNPDFKNLADKGKEVWDACTVLSRTDMDALFFFYLSTSNYLREGLKGFSKLTIFRWPGRAKKVLKRMMAIDPSWGQGSPYYAWANYYVAIPELVGGDLRKAEEYYKTAIDLGPDMLNFRRTRALFLHTKTKNKDAFQKDLSWVLSQDPHKVRDMLTYPFNIFIQRSSKELLANIDDYFRGNK